MKLTTFLPIFFVFLVVFFVAMATWSVKSGKKKNQNQSKRQDAMRVRLEGKTPEDPFSEILKPNDIRFESSPVRTYSIPVNKPPKKDSVVRGTDLVETRPKVHVSANVVGITKSHHDEHCVVEHDNDDLYIVEKVPVSGSIGGVSEEGCGEHYNLRFVKVDEENEDGGKIKVSAESVRKAIVLGEVINDPAYKKY